MSIKKILPLAVSILLVAACSTKNNNDPLESMNRGVFAFNQVTDKYVLRPVAYGYRYVTPTPVRDRLGHVSDNLMEPLNMTNAFLQGDFTQGMTSFWRFIINSTVGIGGMNDVAATAGLKERKEDFGQTLATWGVGSGPYIVLPLLGPSNGRDAVGKLGDWFADPVSYAIDDQSTTFWIAGSKAIIKREQLIDPIDDINASSLDPYSSFRSIYEQRREAEIKNLNSGEPRL